MMDRKGEIPMKQMFFGLALLGLVAGACQAQEPIYRCGNEYTNTKPDARAKGCKLMEGGNVTVCLLYTSRCV